MPLVPDASTVPDPAFWHGFGASISMILVSEIADKTFFIAAIMSAQFNRVTVFAGSIGALIVMTALSVIAGNVMMRWVPIEFTELISACLFLLFGLNSLREGISMKKGDDGEFRETQMELKEAAQKHDKRKISTSNDVECSDENNTFKKSSSKSTTNSQSIKKSKSCLESIRNVFNRIFLQAFSMTFLAEWGDRSQIATISLATTKNPYGVCLGGILGHCVCTGVAVIGGRLLAQKIDARTITIIGAVVFLIFGVVGLVMMGFNGSYDKIGCYISDRESCKP